MVRGSPYGSRSSRSPSEYRSVWCSASSGWPGLPVLSQVVVLYVSLGRATPLVTLVLFFFVTLPVFGVNIDKYTAGVLALTLNTASFNTEVWRSVYQAFPQPQIEAARAMGMTRAAVLPAHHAAADVVRRPASSGERDDPAGQGQSGHRGGRCRRPDAGHQPHRGRDVRAACRPFSSPAPCTFSSSGSSCGSSATSNGGGNDMPPERGIRPMTDLEIVIQELPRLARGFGNTLLLFAVSAVGAFSARCAWWWGRSDPAPKAVRFMLRYYVDGMRMLPFLIFAYLLYYGLPTFGGEARRMDGGTAGPDDLSRRLRRRGSPRCVGSASRRPDRERTGAWLPWTPDWYGGSSCRNWCSIPRRCSATN